MVDGETDGVEGPVGDGEAEGEAGVPVPALPGKVAPHRPAREVGPGVLTVRLPSSTPVNPCPYCGHNGHLFDCPYDLSWARGR